MNADAIIPIAIGVVLLMLGAHNELQWRRRHRNSVAAIGRVVDIHYDGDDGYFPEIEYTFEGNLKRFRSAYSIPPTPFIGDRVPIMIDAQGDNAEYYTSKTRWYFTLFPIVAGLIFLTIGIAAQT